VVNKDYQYMHLTFNLSLYALCLLIQCFVYRALVVVQG